MKTGKPIYVEIEIQAPLEIVWNLTQTPELHQRWDLRFSEIKCLPRESQEVPQQFRYATRLGMGLKIEGMGESMGEREQTGARSSSLRFWSEDRKSLISEGAGFWKYIPQDRSVRFFTRYDYRVRFGLAGKLADRLVFRPLMRWATAWSFDRLRLWAEKGVAPEESLRWAVVHSLARGSLGLAWIWHGLVPKLLARHPAEERMLTDAGISQDAAAVGVILAGILEIVLGVWVLASRNIAPSILTLCLMPLALAGVAWFSPQMILAPFNPVTLNLFMCVAAGLVLLTRRVAPTASRCWRGQPQTSHE